MVSKTRRRRIIDYTNYKTELSDFVEKISNFNPLVSTDSKDKIFSYANELIVKSEGFEKFPFMYQRLKDNLTLLINFKDKYFPEKKEENQEIIDHIDKNKNVISLIRTPKVERPIEERVIESIKEIEHRGSDEIEQRNQDSTPELLNEPESLDNQPITEKEDKPIDLLPKKKVELWSDISQYIAPWIIGNELVKEILATQMFSNPSQGEKLHYLIVGNVASGKSELLDFISACVPNSAYVGKKITRVGMSEKLAKCNTGLISLDEFDKVSYDVRDQLLECMQSQKITDIAHRKDQVLETKVNVLAACNPEKSVLKDKIPIYEQTNLSIPLLSRFHLIMPFYQIDPEFYGDLAVSNNKHKDPDKVKDLQQQIYNQVEGIIARYPTIECPEDILRESGDFIANLRDKASAGSLEYEHINPRTIEGFINFVKARSRMKLKPIAEMEEFEESKEIYKKFYLGDKDGD